VDARLKHAGMTRTWRVRHFRTLNRYKERTLPMSHLNIEIKAKCVQPERVRNLLSARSADFKGIDHQVDTYFKVRNGRLKLREGRIERALIYYDRENTEGPKRSNVILYQPGFDPELKEILTESMGVLAVVDKQREIYFIGNVKFHIDEVNGLGSFVEIEAIDSAGTMGEKKLREQCAGYMDLFEIRKGDLISCSYSDMILNLKN